ncbi:Planctomycete cytochrome C [Polystyrenella longa]|uniref:Planctomycete cytochrome C n=2 Tax=Polystyrenella longa TaxID=2528007 RepID=A0A518CMI8_9PLAN|nr:Planctomycete cytochrome C [Polystyrenella longa]
MGQSAGVLADDDIDFNRDIRLILSAKCFQCHGPDARSREADLRLDTQEGLFGADDSSGVVIPHAINESELFRRLTSEDEVEQMPPADSDIEMTDAEIATLKKWIESGANWAGHWAYIPPEMPEIPAVESNNEDLTDIDHFILQTLQANELGLSPVADPITLVRRLSFDLTGLPPDPAQVAAFLTHPSEQEYEQLVDRLLASPHFGERLAMYWLDLVRYGDTIGYHSDAPQHISPYRDYVIDSFNSNKPFDQFTREQLAGDLLESPTEEQIIATGYNRLNKKTEEGGAQPEEYLTKHAADRVRTTSGAWLGVTLGCAECHDHKYDPFSAKDFYSMAAFFSDIQEVGYYRSGKHDPYIELGVDDKLIKLQFRLEDQLSELRNPAKEDRSLTSEERASKIKEVEEQLKVHKQKLETAVNNGRKSMITVAVEPREMRVLPRGNWLDKTGEVVQAALPESLVPAQQSSDRLTRLDLANWLVSEENPLTARVFMNRMWKLFYGHGLSRRLDDVGSQGEWPTHPELLDYLAIDFHSNGWDIKRAIKNLVMTKTYRQTSIASPELLKRDPENRLLARQSRWRLDAEMIRDNALATSGLLVRTVGGESVKPYQPAGYWQHLNFPTRTWEHDKNENQYRRGLYVFWQRTFLHPSLLAFDAPSREECTAERPISNTPKAALILLNDPSFVEAARCFAVHSLEENNNLFITDRIESLWTSALTRPASSTEQQFLLELFETEHQYYQQHPEAAAELLSVGMQPTPEQLDPVEVASWTSVTRAIMNLHEFITRN